MLSFRAPWLLRSLVRARPGHARLTALLTCFSLCCASATTYAADSDGGGARPAPAHVEAPAPDAEPRRPMASSPFAVPPDAEARGSDSESSAASDDFDATGGARRGALGSAGLGIFLASWLPGLLLGALAEKSDGSCLDTESCKTVWLLSIPVAGPFAVMPRSRGPNPGLAIWGSIQLVGLTMFVTDLALRSRRANQAPGRATSLPLRGGRSLDLDLRAGAAGAGGQLTLHF